MLIRLTGKAGPCKKAFQVAGVDGCRAGWFIVIASLVKPKYLAPQFIEGLPCVFNLKDFFLSRTFADVLTKTTDCKLICVDIPIGLSDGDKPRQCDVLARKILGPVRASSIFAPPVRQCLSAKDYKMASRICFEHSGKRLNRQSFFILPKIREVDEAMTLQLQQHVREIHPELAFWALNGNKPLQHSKKKLAGRNERMKLLAPIFPEIVELIAKARKPQEVAPDDILDALAAAWTASQVVLNNYATLPAKPQKDSNDLRMEIVYPDC